MIKAIKVLEVEEQHKALVKIITIEGNVGVLN